MAAILQRQLIGLDEKGAIADDDTEKAAPKAKP